MAINQFVSYASKSVGTAVSTVFTAQASLQTALIGMTLSNTTDTPVTASAYVTRGGVDVFIVRNATVPVGGSLVAVGGDQKLCLIAGDSVRVTSSTATSIDVWASALLTGGAAATNQPVQIPVVPGLLTVTSWELGRVSTNPPFVQISTPAGGAAYNTLAARTAGSQMILLPQNITVTCTTAPAAFSGLNRVTFSDLTGAGIPAGSGSLGVGTQIQLL